MLKLFERFRIWETRRGKGPFIRSLPMGACLLDVGCGNGSPAYSKWAKPDLCYIGLDVGDYRQTADSTRFADEYRIVAPDRFADAIAGFSGTMDAVVSSHNLEHCDDRRAVLRAVVSALKPGGRMYLSFPSEASAHFPRRRGCLNFYDDATHKHLIPWREVVEDLESLGMDFEFSARRYRPLGIALIGLVCEPVSALRREVMSNDSTWALYGFESVIWARRR